MKILTVVGARPQFVKAAIVSKALQSVGGIKEVLIHTGQHFDANMSDIFFQQFKADAPSYKLDINGQGHGAMTGAMQIEIEKIIISEKPDYLMVYGDTNSTLAGALTAAKLHVPVIHVEAGLRSFNMQMPEEINRILTDHVSQILFCSTDIAVQNLKEEGFYRPQKNHHIVKNGDVMLDMAMALRNQSKRPDALPEGLENFALCTFHRAENTDDVTRLSNIVFALNYIHNNVRPVILPLHPRTKQALEKNNLELSVHLLPPVGYLEMLWLLQKASLVLTDSGGLQKEAYFFDNPCITLREETEWVELVDIGANKLVGASKDQILKAVEEECEYDFGARHHLYGSGKASEVIADTLKNLI